MVDIARLLRLDQKALYRRVERLLKELRARTAGAMASTAAAVLEMFEQSGRLYRLERRHGRNMLNRRPSMTERRARSGTRRRIAIPTPSGWRSTPTACSTAEARAAIERHLADCADCRAVVMETMAFLGGQPRHRRRDARAHGRSPSVPFRATRWVTGVAAGLAAAAALVLGDPGRATGVGQRSVRTAQRPSGAAGADRGGRRTSRRGRSKDG